MPQTIAIIDDDQDTVLFLSTFLEDCGYRVSSACDGERGIALLRAERPDLVLLDLQMPGTTGIRLYLQLQEDPRLRSVPVVVITGLGDFDWFANGCRPAPAPAAFIEKPIDRNALLAVVRRALDRSSTTGGA